MAAGETRKEPVDFWRTDGGVRSPRMTGQRWSDSRFEGEKWAIISQYVVIAKIITP